MDANDYSGPVTLSTLRALKELREAERDGSYIPPPITRTNVTQPATIRDKTPNGVPFSPSQPRRAASAKPRRVYRTGGGLAAKRGRYAASKVKLFLVLADMERYGFHSRFGNCRDLSVATGVPYNTVAVQMNRWWKYSYFSRRTVAGLFGPVREFGRLLAKGETWLFLARHSLPNFPKFVVELETWQSFLAAHPDFSAHLMNMPFEEFERDLKEALKRQAPGN